MFHVRPNSHFVAFTVVFLAVMHSCRGRHLVIGPPEPVVALVGEDVILPCHLNPAMNAFEMTVEWARPDLNPRFVFVWRDGVELKSKNHHLYEGRTSLFTDELKNGNISMILSKVRLSDEGEYKCFVPDVGESKVQLVVGAVSSPVVTINSSELVLQCEAKGWYPEPEVFWLDAEGNLLSAGPTETVRGPDDLYTVSRRLTVEKSDNFTCRVQQKNIKQTKETHFYVPDGFFVVPSTSSQHVVIGSVIGCAALMVVLAAVFVLWKRNQRKSKNKMMSPEDGAEQTEKHKTITSKSENTEVQIEMEEEGESVPLMAAREEKNNEDNRGEQIKSQSEHKDAEFVMERETQQDQLRTKPEPVTCNQDMDVTGGEKTMTPMNDEEVTVIPAQETQRHQNQDNLLGRQVKNDWDKSEAEKMIKPVKEVSGLPVVLVHTDQEVQKEEETQQVQPMEERQPENDVAKKEAETKKGKEQERAEQRGSGRKQKQRENKKKRELEGVKDETEVEPQQRDGDRHLLEDKTQEESKTEHEDDKGNDQEGNQSEFMRKTERTAENQNGQINQNLKDTKEERVFESEGKEKMNSNTENIELKTQKGNNNQHVIDSEKQGAELEDKKQEMTGMTEGKLVNQKEQIEDKLEQTEEKKDERKTEPPPVSREVTERPNLKIHQEPAERKHKELQEENELQAEKQEETKEQPERSTEVVNVEFKERRSDKGGDDDETQKTSKETEKQEELQPAKEEIREQTQNLQFVNEQNRERERTEQLHVVQQQAARRKRDQRKNREPRKEIKKNYQNKPQIQDLNSQEEEDTDL
ncbi:Butyrophilin subfamily 1 member A1 [Larimichthys crocea]|uniref:Uncharacterized protein n=1 Tax=Larimichthys crocea TaxID=215358 RepID=A0ACD3Q5F3_LARCR|nr:Butyrophilin subfamily 1 member A1 [Larimichthys crocea]